MVRFPGWAGGLMPPVVAAVIALLPSLLVSAVVAGITYGIQAALAPNPRKRTLSSNIDRLRNISRDNTAPLRIIYGTYRASGVLAYSRSANVDGETAPGGLFLHALLLLCHGPIEDIYDIQLNDEPADSARFSGLAAFVPFMGADDQSSFTGPVQLTAGVFGQSADSTTVQLPKEWLDGGARPLRQIAYLWSVLRHDQGVFPGGAPTIRATIKGRLVYDPREDSINGGSGEQRRDDATTWRWSNNAALCVRDFLVSREYGMGIPDALIDDAATRAAADVCDGPIDAPSDRETPDDAMPQIARYTIDGLFETDETPIDTLARLLQAMNGALLFHGGQYHMKAGATEAEATDVTTSTPVTLTVDDLRSDEDIQITRLPGRKDRVNIVRGSFVNPTKNYIPDQFPEVTNSQLVAEDGNIELPLQLQLDFTQHPDRASYIAAVTLKRERLMRWSWPVNASGTQLIPLSRVRVTHPHFGWTDKPALIRDRVRLPNGAVNLLLEEYADATWDQDVNPAKFPDPTDLPNPFEVDPPTAVKAVEATQRNPDGTRVAKAVLTWGEPTNGNVDGYVVRWRGLTGATQSRRIASPATRFEIVGLEVGTYVVSIASQIAGGTLSEPVVVQVSITYATTPPPDPVDVRVSQAPNGQRLLSWAPKGGVVPPDVVGWEVRWASGSAAITIDTWNAARLITLAPGLRLETGQPVAPGTYTYLIRSLDASGFYSNDVGGAVVTISPELPDIVLDREFSELGWPVRGDDGEQTGAIIDAGVNAEGHLEGDGDGTWDDPGAWDDAGAWNDGGGTLVYVTPIYDLGSDRSVTIQARTIARHHATATVAARLKRQADAWGLFGPASGGVGRFVQLRVTVTADTDTPTLERFAVRVRERRDVEYQNDLAMAAAVRQVDRVEQTVGHWQAGPWQVNVQPVPGESGRASWRCDPETSLRLDGSTYVGVGDHSFLRLPFGAFTLEATVKLDTTSQTAVVVGKGTDWRVIFTSGVGFQFVVGGTVVAGSTLAATDAGVVYHVAYTYAGGVLSGYLNGALAASVVGVLTVPQSSAVLRAGADQSAGNTMEGVIEDVRIWLIPRSPQEIARDAASPVARTTPGLALWWRCGDATGSTVADWAPFGFHGAVTGTPAWVRMAYRESPPIALSLLPAWRAGRIGYTGALGVGGAIMAQYSVDGGATWTTFGTTPSDIAGIAAGVDPAGLTLRCRQYLESSVAANSPSISRVTVSLSFDRAAGDLVVTPGQPFARIDQAVVAAIQDATGRVPTWALVAKDAVGARFRVTDRLGDPFDTTVDVQLAGARLA